MIGHRAKHFFDALSLAEGSSLVGGEGCTLVRPDSTGAAEDRRGERIRREIVSLL